MISIDPKKLEEKDKLIHVLMCPEFTYNCLKKNLGHKSGIKLYLNLKSVQSEFFSSE